MPARFLQPLGGFPHYPRYVSACIDDRIPISSLQRRKIAIAVAMQLLYIMKQLWTVLSAVEKCNAMPTCKDGLHQMPITPAGGGGVGTEVGMQLAAPVNGHGNGSVINGTQPPVIAPSPMMNPYPPPSK